MKKSQPSDKSGVGAVLVGALIGFTACLFLKEEERKKIIEFLGDKTKKAVKEGKIIAKQIKLENETVDKPRSSARKRFFQKRT
jgi:gas vesicle protein